VSYSLHVEGQAETMGALELTSIAVGYQAADAMIKKSPIILLDSRAYCPGKFLIICTGELASVEEAMQAGIEGAGSSLFASMLIPNLSPQVISAINRECKEVFKKADTIGVIESFSAVAILEAADSAKKNAEIELQSITLLEGLGGKAYVILTGLLADVESAVKSALLQIPEELLVTQQIIPQVSPELFPFFPGSS
jgi:microcompartment protein CcmL/EutN